MSRFPALTAAALACASVLALSTGTAGASTLSCAKVAATTGNDAAAGTAAAPYKTVQKLADALGAGQTGCLRAGTFAADTAVATSGITITSYPGESATVQGRLWIKQGANDVTFANLKINGKNSSLLPSPTVNGDRATFDGVEVTNDNTEICFLIGSSWGRAHGTVIENSRIHNCGRIPSSNQDHGIYVSEADNTQILNNVIYNNVDRGVQLYPDAQGTVIRGNIIDGNGEGVIFSGDSGKAASNTTVEGNVLSNAKIRTNVESWYPAGNPTGTGNVVRNNCIWGGAGGAQSTAAGGFSLTSNTTADPQFADRANGDFRIAASSRCAAVLKASAAPAGLSGQAPVATVSAPADSTPVTTPSAPSTGSTSTAPSTGSTPTAPSTGTTTTPKPSTGTTTTPKPSTGTTSPVKTTRVYRCTTSTSKTKVVTKTCKWVTVTVAAKAKAAKAKTARKATAKKATAKKKTAKRAAVKKTSRR